METDIKTLVEVDSEIRITDPESFTDIEGFMDDRELIWLNEQAKTKQTIVEIGSWCGRSTYALLKDCPGTVYAVDHFKGSEEHQGTIEAGLNPYEEFMKNVGHFKNLRVMKMTSLEASMSEEIPREVDMVFIDGAHDYDSVMADLKAWSPRAKFLCGHDAGEGGVPDALRDYFGKQLKGTVGCIWCREGIL
jgi:predicted O-methyltransferase YrrM